MVLEEISIGWLLKRPFISLFLGFVYALVGYIIATLFFFDGRVSVAMLFLTSIFIIPTIIGILKFEEKIESTNAIEDAKGIKNFFISHRVIIEITILLFIGTFIGYVILGVLAQENTPKVFEYQLSFLASQEGLDTGVIDNFFDNPQKALGSKESLAGIILNNLSVMLICFFLSIAFGAGAIFLVVLNASICAAFGVVMLKYLTTNFWGAVKLVMVFSIHFVPEIGGFIIAAVSGGILSYAILTEKFSSGGFRNVAKYSLMLFVIASLFIVTAAFLEVYVTPVLFRMF